jgi:hypothetical protein
MKELSKQSILSMIRRVQPELIAQNIVGVQPMTSQAGQIFSLRTRYDTRPLRQGDDYTDYQDYVYWVSPSSKIHVQDCVKWCEEVFGEILGDRWKLVPDDLFIFRNAADRNWFIIRWGA